MEVPQWGRRVQVPAFLSPTRVLRRKEPSFLNNTTLGKFDGLATKDHVGSEKLSVASENL